MISVGIQAFLGRARCLARGRMWIVASVDGQRESVRAPAGRTSVPPSQRSAAQPVTPPYAGEDRARLEDPLLDQRRVHP